MEVKDQSQKWLALGVVGLITALFITGCSSANQPAAAAAPATSVNVQLAWVHGSEYAGFYEAEEKGYYAAENLAVKLNELGDTSPIDQVVNGKADFGITSADTLLLARAKGAPVVAIATIFQRSPVAFISLAEKNISRPQDLVGKRVLVHFDGTTGLVYKALLAAQGIDPSKVEGVPRTDFSNKQLLDGEVDVSDAFITNQPVHLAQEGHEINAILASDYGIDIYANVIFTSETTIANKSELVERFLKATIQGIQSVVQNPKEAAALALARNADLKLESETESMNRSLPLLSPAGGNPGTMRPEDWEITHQILLDQGVLDKPLDPKTAYNLSFLGKIYSK
ncbi:MAG: ABC transporter substrate-binding protein [Anaerolineales bacterium]|nr:ABC transporter substrate-binding protein [Anaerolineales bacterium]